MDPELPHHRLVESAQGDRAFLATFLGLFLGLTCGLAALVRVTDPLAAFGGGVLPPVVSVDRDYKAGLYRAATPRPVVVLLGSSRVKTLRPACVEALTGAPAFNFGVNAGVAEDFVAIGRLLRAEPRAVRQILLGADPESFTGEAGAGRALRASRMLARHAPLGPGEAPSIHAVGLSDLLGWESVAAALRSVRRRYLPGGELPQEAIAPDGWQTHPRWDSELADGRYRQPDRVSQSVAAVSTRYRDELRLSPARLSLLEVFLREARESGFRVTAFIPPVHPDLARSRTARALPRLTAEMDAVLRDAERRGLLRYVETSPTSPYGTDPRLYYDAVHMMAGNGDRLLTRLFRDGQGAGCAVQ